jgi:hypothetical protein
MGSRTHDYHCRNCHAWVNGFDVDEGATCGCGRWDGFYDINNDGCDGVGGCGQDVSECDTVLTIDQGEDHWVVRCFQPAGHVSPHTSAIVWPNARGDS